MIVTVLGNIEKEEIVLVLPHEHILSDLRPLAAPLDNSEFYEKLSLSNFGLITRNPYAVLDNAVLEDCEVQIKEFEVLKKAGCNLVADVTTEDFGRNPEFLKEISQRTGVHVVAGCGCYIDSAVDGNIKLFKVRELYDKMMTELTEGIGGTDIKAGVIGEVGSSEDITEFEYKSLEAAAMAQRETGAGMHIHAYLWNREGIKALKYAIKCGANPEKICVDHVDVKLDIEYMKQILDLGSYIEFDDFGKEFYVDRKNRNLLKDSFASDRERVQTVKKFIDSGYLNQILISNDVCLKSMTHAYGGWGYDHVITNIMPMMEDYDIKEKQINTLMRENPLRFLERQ